MGLDLSGQGGELRHGTHRVADLATWSKKGKRVRFTTRYINQFAAGMGPPTAIVLPVTAKVRRVYPVTGGTLESGIVDVDLMAVSSEKA